MYGVLCVMTPGELVMQLWCVDNWVILLKVRSFPTCICIVTCSCILTAAVGSTGSVAFSSAHFGRGTGPIYLDNVRCSGSESKLANCPHSPSVSCYYGHLEDAGVRCQGCFMHIIMNLGLL